MLNYHILRFDSLGHICRFYNRILFSECDYSHVLCQRFYFPFKSGLPFTSDKFAKSQIGCALALANFSFCQSSGPMVQHYCHGSAVRALADGCMDRQTDGCYPSTLSPHYPVDNKSGNHVFTKKDGKHDTVVFFLAPRCTLAMCALVKQIFLILSMSISEGYCISFVAIGNKASLTGWLQNP